MRVWMVLFGVAALLGAARAADQQQLSEAQIEEITQKFAAKESEFARARENYTYRQTARVQELDEFGNVRGVWEMVSDIVFSLDGKRTERVVRAPVSTLRDLQLEPADEQDLRNVLPFVLNTAELPKYFVRYLGKQNIDEIPCFVFAVKPKKLEAGQRYFQGQVWVDDRDLQIVKSYGRGVGLLRKNSRQPVPEVRDLPRADRRQVLVSHLHSGRRCAVLPERAAAHAHAGPLRGLQAVQERNPDQVRRARRIQGEQEALTPRRSAPRPRLRTALLLFASALVVYNLNFQRIAASDTVAASLLPFSLWLDGSIAADRFYPYLAQHAPAQALGFFVKDGHAYSGYPIAVPLLLAPLYAPAALVVRAGAWDTERIVVLAGDPGEARRLTRGGRRPWSSSISSRGRLAEPRAGAGLSRWPMPSPPRPGPSPARRCGSMVRVSWL